MKIGIIGSGKIGGTLGSHWAQAGHEVLFSSRHPESLRQLALDAGKHARAVTVEEAFVARADAYLLAVPFRAIDGIAEQFAGEYGNAVIIDATNPYPQRDGEMARAVRESNRNASEYTATKFSTALTAKAFNTIYAKDLRERAFRETDRLAIPFSAQDKKSRELTETLILDIGMDPVYLGELGRTDVMEVDKRAYGVSTTKTALLELLNR